MFALEPSAILHPPTELIANFHFDTSFVRGVANPLMELDLTARNNAIFAVDDYLNLLASQGKTLRDFRVTGTSGAAVVSATTPEIYSLGPVATQAIPLRYFVLPVLPNDRFEFRIVSLPSPSVGKLNDTSTPITGEGSLHCPSSFIIENISFALSNTKHQQVNRAAS